MTLKLYMYDHGWSGAQIIADYSLEAAAKRFNQMHQPGVIKLNEMHLKDHPTRPNPWPNQIEQYSVENIMKAIEEFEISESLMITSRGE